MHRALKAGVGKNLDVIANPSPSAITLRPTLIATKDVAPGVAVPQDRQIAVKFAIEEGGVVIGEFVDHKSAEAVCAPSARRIPASPSASRPAALPAAAPDLP